MPNVTAPRTSDSQRHCVVAPECTKILQTWLVNSPCWPWTSAPTKKKRPCSQTSHNNLECPRKKIRRSENRSNSHTTTLDTHHCASFLVCSENSCVTCVFGAQGTWNAQANGGLGMSQQWTRSNSRRVRVDEPSEPPPLTFPAGEGCGLWNPWRLLGVDGGPDGTPTRKTTWRHRVVPVDAVVALDGTTSKGSLRSARDGCESGTAKLDPGTGHHDRHLCKLNETFGTGGKGRPGPNRRRQPFPEVQVQQLLAGQFVDLSDETPFRAIWRRTHS